MLSHGMAMRGSCSTTIVFKPKLRETCSPVLCAEETWLLVLVANGAQIAPYDLKIRVLADVVLRHLEHAQMEVGEWAERAARDEDEGLLLRVAKNAREAVSGELVIWRVRELARRRW